MRGWFDMARVDGGPTLYGHSNRTAVTGDVTLAALWLAAATLLVAFLVIFPGVRKERFATFSCVTISLFVGTAILVTCHGSSWHIASNDVVATYRAFSRERMRATVGAYVGLLHVNITLKAIPTYDNRQPQNRTYQLASQSDVDFNERFVWGGSSDMQVGYRSGLARGLPFPLLTVAEALSLNAEGFSWGGQYRHAGYYTSFLLWASLAAWASANLLLIVVPRYGAYAMVGTGGLMLGATSTYWTLLPATAPMVRFEGAALSFKLGWCFWLCVSAGALAVVAGLAVAAVDLVFPHRFSTVLEVDYDTPYDRHIIIEESRSKPAAAAAEAAAAAAAAEAARGAAARTSSSGGAGNLGTRILRRLSRRGVDNAAFQPDGPAPNSTWRYPRLQAPRVAAFRRTDSQDSASSAASSVRVSFGTAAPPSSPSTKQPPLNAVRPHIPVHPALRRSIPDMPEKHRDVAMW